MLLSFVSTLLVPFLLYKPLIAFFSPFLRQASIQNGKTVFVEAPKPPLGNRALVNGRRINMISYRELVNRLAFFKDRAIHVLY
jgi:hypothetical protein